MHTRFSAIVIEILPGDSDEVRWIQVGIALHAVQGHLRIHVQRDLKQFLQQMQKYAEIAHDNY